MTDPLEPKKDFRSGFIAICGPPNAGKSTLLNLLAGEKISITSDKPQTTRNRILGVVNRKNAQVVFVDTPGIFRPKGKLNTAIVGTAVSALADVDVILLVIDVVKPRKDAEHLTIEHLKHHNKPVVLALNKIDRIKKHKLLEMIDSWQRLYAFERIVPISALESIQTEDLMAELETLLPEGGPLFPEEMLTDAPERFLAAEMIREKVFRLTGQEIPYATAVTIDTFKEKKEGSVIHIQATIHVERDSQKGIVIGKQGAMLKQIGQESRQDIEQMTGARVFLELFVRVQKNWSSDDRRLSEFGYP
ncbi:GTPase Era [Desulfosudis oleivorans]|uniref:GTPase Era n=1 Tax=Desulfosudis oleivorans (strain DSM 6200 / JCM 39069 / Hxd3) TaxID=96561 RepID=A8ZXG5_DESOH|nr:GTPase Era [Desulfosudis oleivorans]ABW66923.1 GTP-binding protein Era [Desulfosudis oleivorans Hxd3]